MLAFLMVHTIDATIHARLIRMNPGPLNYKCINYKIIIVTTMQHITQNYNALCIKLQ